MLLNEFSKTILAPAANDIAEPRSGGSAYLLRQPVSNRQQKLLGYELRWLHAGADGALRGSPLVQLLNLLKGFNPTQPLGADALVFAELPQADLFAELPACDFAARVVLQLPKLDASQIGTAVPRLAQLRKQGFHLAIGPQALAPAYAPWLEHVGFAFLDASAEPGKVALALKQLGGEKKVCLVAQRVMTRELYSRAADMGFSGFMGPFFAQLPMKTRSAASPVQASLIKVISLVQREADAGEIEQVLRRDPALSFKLMRYVNSAGFGAGREVSSFRHAVMLVGYQPLQRWLFLVLATVTDGNGASMLSRMAVVRGRLLELLAEDAGLGAERDNAFILGVFSLMDVMLGQSMAKVLEQVVLPDATKAALLNRAGQLGQLLKLAESCERWVADAGHHPDEWMGISGTAVTLRHLEALAWSESLGI
jgi:c-di-GMP-related signal transduction protein